ncbi:MAG: efflux RND transporter periplasmic adaptor subunit [Rhizobacter sp.]|nr:efflux RND transporter periplasmic adaptor subunit [Chlorobiales bacterium]
MTESKPESKRQSELRTETKSPAAPQPPRLWLYAGIAVGVLVLLLVIGTVPRLIRNSELAQAAETEKSGIVSVNVSKPRRAPATTDLLLPAGTEAIQQTPIYARTNGFVKQWFTDIGSTVKRGQLMAILETPELDQELIQSRANLSLAKANLERLKSVSLPGAISQQDRDEKQASFDATAASVGRLGALASFKRITAPFAGVVTLRTIDVGTLISSGDAKELFRLEQTDTLRLMVNVPQTYAPSVKTGTTATVLLPEFPNRTFEGVIVRTAGALDPATRTLLTEIHLPNATREVMSGMYAQVKLRIVQATPLLIVAAKTLKIGEGGAEVAIVMVDGKVHYQKVQLGRDFGTEVEIISGLTGAEMLVENPTDDVYEGRTVKPLETKVIPPATPPAKGGQAK